MAVIFINNNSNDHLLVQRETNPIFPVHKYLDFNNQSEISGKLSILLYDSNWNVSQQRWIGSARSWPFYGIGINQNQTNGSLDHSGSDQEFKSIFKNLMITVSHHIIN